MTLPPQAPPAPPEPLLPAMAFRYDWRVYQRQILEDFAVRDPAKKRTFHVVAPPGAGKTLVGLEIIRRVGRPAVTFSPTTTIQEQWKDKVRLFLPDPPPGASDPPALAEVSTEPEHLGAISCLTYQSLATQTQEREFLDRVGRQAWIDELVEGDRTPEGAEAYLRELEQKGPGPYSEGVRRRAAARKRKLLESGEATIEQLLHPNALDLVERIVALDVGVIVLDEAHHLLDYWAMILACLIARLPTAIVVGLTATPPASAEGDELDNYLALVDGIDFEVPTPAVVRSGNLAPYQDLVLITRPTDGEKAFLSSQHQLLEQAFARAFDDQRFPAFVEATVNRPDAKRTWQDLLSEEFEIAVAGVRYLLERNVALAPDVETVPEMLGPLTTTDRGALVRWWCLGFLRLSKEPADEQALADLKAALRTLGLSMTETGWRKTTSPTDRVLAYSRSKTDGAVTILAEESQAMGDRLRAVVLTDFERSSPTALRRLEGVLDKESGGAVQAIRALVADQRTAALDPVMVTGRTVLADAGAAQAFLEDATAWFAQSELTANLVANDAGDGLVEIDGDGADWQPRYYVSWVTDMFDRGLTKCIVGTRGLLAEGWDSLVLNTLVDLTTAGTFASVNQIRGRSIRLDPAWPRKVADNWDVVCLDATIQEGRDDFDRFLGKHRHVWGLSPDKRIVKGAGHVDQRLQLIEQQPTNRLQVELVNKRSMRRAQDRDHAYDEWGIGSPFENFEFRGTVLAGPPEQLKTAYSYRSALRALINIILFNLIEAAILIGYAVPQAKLRGWSNAQAALVAALMLALSIGVSIPFVVRFVKRSFVELPVTAYLADFAHAVADAMTSTGIAPASPDRVRVAEGLDGTYDIHLDTPDRAAADAFSATIADLFQPIVDQRYLIEREELSKAGFLYRPVWLVLRWMLRRKRHGRPIYHPVPSTFARKRELADAFALSWTKWVGGGRLVYTRNPEGAAILLRERAGARRDVAAQQIDEWR
jgi:superfamily II DNA or RNA helicase